MLAASSLLAAGVATAGAGNKATGGGQVLVGTKGAGDTVAFTAQDDGSGAKGMVNYQDREDGSETGQTHYHGDVDCIMVEANVAYISGTWADGGSFQLYVEDNGEGAGAESDIVTLMQGEAGCDFDAPDDEDKIALARGNAQVHKQ